MNRGYVKLWRKTIDSGLLQNAAALQVFTYCLLKASHKHSKMLVGTTPVTVEPGQVVTGRLAIAKECKLSERNVRTALKLLENLEIVTIKPTNKFSIVSFVNWDTYQQDGPAERPAECPASDQQVTSTRPASDHKQEFKNLININTPLTPQGGESESTGTKKRSNRNAEYSQDFLDFWAIYPRKDNKRGAWKAYHKAQNEGRLPDDLLERLRNKCLCDQWSKDGGQYIPYAERWLNKDGWEDADCEIESYAAGWEEELAKLGEIYRRCEVGIFDSEEERARKNEIYKNEYEPMLDDLHRRGCRAI